MHVIGTAGHVDHGKTTLITALTGINPDRLKEEQQRQMTIDLGFAWLTLPNGEEIGIVDVPGHRDFIENMLAGVGGIDAALLVIAADEGVMPQTREHLAILDLLQIPAGVVALTKIDLIDDLEWLDLLEADIRAILRGTVLQDAPILRVSSQTRAGFPALLQTLSLLLQNRPPRPDLGRPRLPVDRVFTMPGFGTVVTGTLTDGSLRLGDEVEILPAGLRGRIRGLQTHRRKEDAAVPGSRTAVNLSGVEAGQIRRGDVLAHPGRYQPTGRLDVHFRLLAEASPLQHHTEVKLFLGAAETIANIRLLGKEVLQPGETGWLQLELRDPLVAVRGDRFILRRPSPAETLGGGVVVDSHPRRRHKRFDTSVLQSLETLAKGSPADVLVEAAQALGPAMWVDVLARSRLEESSAHSALQELLKAGQLIQLEEFLVSASHWQTLVHNAQTALAAYHRAYPLRQGMPREELRSKLKLPARLFNLVAARFLEQEIVVVPPTPNHTSPLLALPEHRVCFSPEQETAVQRLIKQFATAPFAPPSVKECQAEVGEEVFAALLDSGDLIQVSAEVVFRREDYEAMMRQVRQAITQKGAITLAEVRDLLGTSRKYVQALLEHLDSIGVTMRVGDSRQLKG